MTSVSWLWTNPASYNFASSEWGGLLFHVAELGVLYLLLRPLYGRVRAHLECHEATCSKWGHPVPGTGYRACHDHHPAVAHEPGEAVTAEHIRTAYIRASGGGG